MYVARNVGSEYSKHPEFEVSFAGTSIGRYNRVAYCNTLIAVRHPVDDAYPNRPYLIFIDKNEVSFIQGVIVMSDEEKLASTLRAIVARINGEWDNKDLQEFGELTVDTDADVVFFAQDALVNTDNLIEQELT